MDRGEHGNWIRIQDYSKFWSSNDFPRKVALIMHLTQMKSFKP